MEPLLRNLEASLEISKAKLKEESRLRRHAELSQVELEARYNESEQKRASLEKENEELRVECGAFQEELKFTCRELEKSKAEFKQNHKQLSALGDRVYSAMQRREEQSETTPRDTSTATDSSKIDDSYGEVLDELETITEQLISTQQKLWKTEDALRESDAQVRILQNQRNQDQLSEPNSGNSLQNNAVTQTEKRLTDELQMLRKELEVAQEELRTTEKSNSIQLSEEHVDEIEHQRTTIKILKSQLDDLEATAAISQQRLTEHEYLLSEARNENSQLVEELAGLQQVLREKEHEDSSALESSLRSSIEDEVRASLLKQVHEEREREITVLRDKFKKIFKENAALREKIDELEGDLPPTDLLHNKYQDEISSLKASLASVHEQQQSVVLEAEATWRTKYDRDMKNSNHVLQEKADVLSKQRDLLETKVEKLQRDLSRAKKENERKAQQLATYDGNMKSSRDEIIKLKTKIGLLSTDLEHSLRTINRMDAHSEQLQKENAEALAELEVARQILEESGLEEETINRDDIVELRQQIHHLNTSLEKARIGYLDLEAVKR